MRLWLQKNFPTALKVFVKIEESWGVVAFLVAIVTGIIASIWSALQEPTAPFWIPTFILTACAILWFVQQIRNEKPSGVQQPVEQASTEPDDKDQNSALEVNLQEQLESALGEARKWEYEFLNKFYVDSTQNILDWLYKTQAPASYDLFAATWNSIDGQQRIVIIGALHSHELITVTKKTITISDKGKDYVEWRGLGIGGNMLSALLGLLTKKTTSEPASGINSSH